MYAAAFCVFVLAVPPEVPNGAADPGESAGVDPDQVISAAVASIEQNRRQLPPVVAEIKVIRTDRTVSEPGVRTARVVGSDGTKVRFRVEPRTEWTEQVLADGARFEYRRLSEAGTLEEAWSSVGADWKQVMPGEPARHVIYPAGQLPARLPIDPREFGSFSMKESLLEMLIKASPSVDALAGSETGTIGLAVPHEGGAIEVELAPDFSFLPVRVFDRYDDGISMMLTLTYKAAFDSGAYFLDTAEYRFFKDPVGDPASDDWTESIEYRLEKLELAAGLPCPRA